MANFLHPKPSGWADEDPLTPKQANDIGEALPKMANFAEGSTHTPSAPVIVGGSGMEFRDTAIKSRRGIVDPTPALNWSYMPLSRVGEYAFDGRSFRAFASGSDSQYSLISSFISEDAYDVDATGAATVGGAVYIPDRDLMVVFIQDGDYVVDGARVAASVTSGQAKLLTGSSIIRVTLSGNTLYSAVSNDSGALAFSLGSQATNIGVFQGFGVGSNRVIATGYNGGSRYVAYADVSADFTGNPWTDVDITSLTPGNIPSYAPAYCSVSDTWILPLNGTDILISDDDGETWLSTTFISSGNVQSVACGGGIWVALFNGGGNSLGRDVGFAVSADFGATWYTVGVPEIGQVRFEGGRFVMMGAAGIYYTPRIAGLVTPMPLPLN